jgi:uroporphyrinogen decarboxylase
VMPIGSALLAGACGLRRIDNFLMDLAADPANAEAMLDKVLALHLERLSRLLPAVADTVDIVWIGDDFGTENGPFISPQMFRRFLKPRFATLIGHIRKLAPKVTVFLHSCGSIYALLPDLIEAGFEVINPVQISARNMEPARLKREFGRDVTFWGGGCDTQHFLPRATPQQIRDHVRRNIDILAPGGGFVFCPVHNLLAEVPPEKIVAIYEAAMP